MDATPDADTEMLRLVLDGDVRAAAGLLVARYADEVYGLCRAMTRDPIAAEDLSQDVFGRAFTALGAFRGEASPRTWLLRIARNRCIDHLRAERRQPWADADSDPDGEAHDEPRIDDLLERRADVSRALEALVEGERALVVLRFGHGLAYPELADAFGLKEGAVRMRISRAVAKMRAELDGDLGISTAVGARTLGAPAPQRGRGAPSRGRPAAPGAPTGGPPPPPRAMPIPGSPAAPGAPPPPPAASPSRHTPPAAPPLPGRPSPAPSGRARFAASGRGGPPANVLAAEAPRSLRERLGRMLGAL